MDRQEEVNSSALQKIMSKKEPTRLLKARCMHLGIHLQLVREKTILSVKPSIDQQDLATKAWNFCTALYYKGNRTVPWRLVEDKFKPKTCYIGIGFYKSRDGETVSTSLAQVFDEFGHGVTCEAHRCR